jgi:hypothetical protein
MERNQFEGLKRGDLVKTEFSGGVQIWVFICHTRTNSKSGNSWTGYFSLGRRTYELSYSAVDFLLSFDNTRYRIQIESAIESFNKFHKQK